MKNSSLKIFRIVRKVKRLKLKKHLHLTLRTVIHFLYHYTVEYPMGYGCCALTMQVCFVTLDFYSSWISPNQEFTISAYDLNFQIEHRSCEIFSEVLQQLIYASQMWNAACLAFNRVVFPKQEERNNPLVLTLCKMVPVKMKHHHNLLF